MQSPKSCSDQEREVREALSRMGIDHASAVVIHDQAETGTATYRDEFQRLESMLAAKEIGLLAVADQARLTRADNAFAFIMDVVFSGGRFVSTGEGSTPPSQAGNSVSR
jgi:DNA invertase Pin-like site-specific DNA recombinase